MRQSLYEKYKKEPVITKKHPVCLVEFMVLVIWVLRKGGVLMTKKYLKIDELSEYLGEVKVNTIYSWISQKKIPFTKIGRLVRFDIGKIDEWIKSHSNAV